MKRKSHCEDAQGALEDAAYLLAQMPNCRAQEIIVHVTTPDLLGLGSNPVVSRRRAGRLIASTRWLLRGGRCVVTLQWETETPGLTRRKPMSVREFLKYVEAAA